MKFALMFFLLFGVQSLIAHDSLQVELMTNNQNDSVLSEPYCNPYNFQCVFRTTLDILPNPANDYLVFSLNAPLEITASIAINDLGGRNIYSIATKKYNLGRTSLVINTEDFAQGIYILSFTSKEIRLIRKFIIIH